MMYKKRSDTAYYATTNATSIDRNEMFLFSTSTSSLFNKKVVMAPTNRFVTPMKQVGTKVGNALAMSASSTQPAVQSVKSESQYIPHRSSIAQDIGNNSKRVVAKQDISLYHSVAPAAESSVADKSMPSVKALISNLEFQKSATNQENQMKMRQHLQEEMKERYGGIRNFTNIIRNQTKKQSAKTVDNPSEDSDIVPQPSENEEFTVNYGFFKVEQPSAESQQTRDSTALADSSSKVNEERLFTIQSDFIDKKFADADEIIEQMEQQATQAVYKKYHQQNIMMNNYQSKGNEIESYNANIQIISKKSD